MIMKNKEAENSIRIQLETLFEERLKADNKWEPFEYTFVIKLFILFFHFNRIYMENGFNWN